MANYQITATDELTEGGAKTKARQNIAAIRLLKDIEQAQRTATPNEQAVLIRYAGWGVAADIFTAKPEWAALREELEATLTVEEFAAARASTINAFYTDVDITAEIYKGIERLGFTGGTILDPSMGASGIFEGMMPPEMANRSAITGVELDSISGRIASQLYPEATIYVQGFQDVILPDDYFDLTISNVPFSEVGVSDPRYKGQPVNTLHDYFFAKGLDKVRPGGLVTYITSTGTMQSAKGEPFREYLSDRANLVGAMRLPGDAFKKNAGTEVTTDLIILQKLGDGVEPNGIAWTALKETGVLDSEGRSLKTNEYYAQRPELMLGKLSDDKLYPGRLALKGDGRDITAAIKQAFDAMPEAIYQERLELVEESDRILVPPELQSTVKQNGFVLYEGELMVREGDYLELSSETGKPYERIIGLMKVRDAVQNVFNVQLQEGGEEELEAAQAILNRTYDSFVKKNGYIHSRGNTQAFRDDPDYPLLRALEKYDPDEKTAQKTDIFSKRTIQPHRPKTEADNAKEGLLFSLNELGKVDISYIAKLTSQSRLEIISELQQDKLIFKDPDTQAWQTQDEYLSGNVKQKLEIAQAAAADDEQFNTNIEALQAVQPEPLLPGDIDIRLGSVWVPEADVEAFVQELLGVEEGIRVQHSQSANRWYVNAAASVRQSKSNLNIYGTGDVGATQLIELTLNLSNPTVFQPDPNDPDKRVVDQDATAAARLKQEEIKEKFRGWVWQNPERTSRLTDRYNAVFNTNRERQYDGSHLELPGKNPNFVLRKHQADAVYRSLAGNMLLAHVVGAGKTAEMICSAMEQKRLSLANKPMFVVPNHLLEQWAGEIKHLYPTANILAATKKDSSAANRQQLMSRIATGQWDAVVVTHTAFEKLQLSSETQGQFLSEEYEKVRDAISSLSKGGDESRRVMKDLEKKKLRLEERISEVANDERKDNTLTFEQLGIDLLLVDESHYFKNLGYVTKMRSIAGLPNTESKRAFDMHMKVRYMAQVRGEGKGVIFATGTPIANSMAELYTVQRYLQPKALERMGLASFDDWASVFGETTTSAELAATGKFQVKTRFSSFVNMPELMGTVRQVMDIQTADMLKLPVPELSGGKPTIIAVPATDDQLAYMDSLVRRAENMSNVDPQDDNMLKLTGNGRSASADMRLLFPNAEDHPDSKINRFVEDAFDFWQENGSNKTHLVFCDLGTPKKVGEFSLYQDIKDKLVAKGVPDSAIAFAQDYKTDAKKLQLQQNFNKGKVAILISGAQLETGFNGQRKLARISHLTVPWRPDQIEQRDGRMIRQGNENSVVESRRYVTQGRNGQPGIDGYFWQTLETKAGFISQVMKGSTDVRRMSDVSTEALNYSEIKAIATGNPLIMEKATLDNTIRQLSAQKRAHTNAQYRIRQELGRLPEQIDRLTVQLDKAQADLKTARQANQGGTITLFGQTLKLDQADDIGKRIRSKAADLRSAEAPSKEKIGSLGGFALYIQSGGKHSDAPTYLKIEGQAEYFRDKILKTKASAYRPIKALLDADVANYVNKLQQELEGRKKDLKDLSAQTDTPFPKEEELAAATKRLAEVHEGLKVDAKTQQTGSLRQVEPPSKQQTPTTENIAKLIAKLGLERNVLSKEGFYLSLPSADGGAALVVDADDGTQIKLTTEIESEDKRLGTIRITATFQVDEAGILTLESASSETHPEIADEKLLASRLAQHIAHHDYQQQTITQPVEDKAVTSAPASADQNKERNQTAPPPLAEPSVVKLSPPSDEVADRAIKLQLQKSIEEAREQTASQQQLYEGDHITISRKPEQNGIEIRFAEKPSKDWTQQLSKVYKFRFSKKDNDPRWYKKESKVSIPLIVGFADRYEKAIASQQTNSSPKVAEQTEEPKQNNTEEPKVATSAVSFAQHLADKQGVQLSFSEKHSETEAIASHPQESPNIDSAPDKPAERQAAQKDVTLVIRSLHSGQEEEISLPANALSSEESKPNSLQSDELSAAKTDQQITLKDSPSQTASQPIAEPTAQRATSAQNAAEFIHKADLAQQLSEASDFSLRVENGLFLPLVIEVISKEEGKQLSFSQYSRDDHEPKLIGQASFEIAADGLLTLTDTTSRSPQTGELVQQAEGGDAFFAQIMLRNIISQNYPQRVKEPIPRKEEIGVQIASQLPNAQGEATQISLYDLARQLQAQSAARSPSNPTEQVTTAKPRQTTLGLAQTLLQHSIEDGDQPLHTALSSDAPTSSVHVDKLRDWYVALYHQKAPSEKLEAVQQKGKVAAQSGSVELTKAEQQTMKCDIKRFTDGYAPTTVDKLRAWYRANAATKADYTDAIKTIALQAKTKPAQTVQLRPTDQVRMAKDLSTFNHKIASIIQPGLQQVWAIARRNNLALPDAQDNLVFSGKTYSLSADKNSALTLTHKPSAHQIAFSSEGKVLTNNFTAQQAHDFHSTAQKMIDIASKPPPKQQIQA